MPVPAMPQPVKSRRINLANAVWIWIYWQAGRIPEAAAIGLMLILITAVMGLAARKLVGESLSGPRH